MWDFWFYEQDRDVTFASLNSTLENTQIMVHNMANIGYMDQKLLISSCIFVIFGGPLFHSKA